VTLPSVLAHLRAHGVEPNKALGQNFITDLNITDKIVLFAGPLPGHTVIEIGPGPGGLSRSILEHRPEQLVVVEQDQTLTNLLEEIKGYHSNFSVYFADALKTDVTALGPAPRKIIANLPYNIATPLMLRWLEKWHSDPHSFSSLTLMFQKEVVDRLIAKPRSKAYGRLSVMVQWICEVEAKFHLPPHVFLPPPKVTSTVAHFVRRPHADGTFKHMEKVVAAAFSQRRKTLKKAMRNNFPDIENVLNKIGIAPTARAEELSVAQFTQLAGALE